MRLLSQIPCKVPANHEIQSLKARRTRYESRAVGTLGNYLPVMIICFGPVLSLGWIAFLGFGVFKLFEML
jgi:hypothetical protein